jgi:glycosyltransferase involved in cell wall biosynthesis
MKIAFLTTDNREHFKRYELPQPLLPPPQEALLEGFTGFSGIEVHVISCTQREMAAPEKLARNVWYHSVHVPKLGWLRTGYQGCIRAVRAKLARIKPDIVHGQGTERECAVCAAFSGYPNVITIHGNMAEIARLFKARPFSFDWLTGKLEDVTLPSSGGVFCNSEYTEALVVRRARRTWRVPNPLRSEFFSQERLLPSPGLPILINVGVISERKRQTEIINAFRASQKLRPTFRLEFVGAVNPTSEYGSRFLQLLKDPEISSWVTYLGTADTATLIKQFDRASALIHFPLEEAFGLAVAEALARGLPLFGSRVGGIVDISQNVPGTNLFESDDWEGLRRALNLWISEGAKRADAARVIMRERYHPAVVAARHLEIYRQVISDRR